MCFIRTAAVYNKRYSVGRVLSQMRKTDFVEPSIADDVVRPDILLTEVRDRTVTDTEASRV